MDQAKWAIVLIGFTLAVLGLIGAMVRPENARSFLTFAGLIGAITLLLVTGHVFRELIITKSGAKFLTSDSSGSLRASSDAQRVPPRPLVTQKQLDQRRDEFRSKPTPGLRAGVRPFQLLDDPAAVRPMPGADPTVPIYRLDKDFRILDWNESFSLAFDGALEGRRGQNAQEWVFFLENYNEVMAHGAATFGDPNNLPRFDYELLKYKSRRYGKIEAGKRAYQVPAADGSVDSWICVLDLQFSTPDIGLTFQLDLIAILRDDLLWSEYAVSYDRVLTNTMVYEELIAEILGETGRDERLEPVGSEANVIDLGAGTGNIALRLAEGSNRRSIVAVDKNRFMLGALRSKCQKYLSTDRNQPGIIAVKQDATNLYGLPANHFDVAILNNVLYAVSDPEKCLSEVYRVLKPRGQIRLTGPKKNTNLDILFGRIKNDIETARRWKEVADDYVRVKYINEHWLSDILYQWTAEEVRTMLRDVGFDGGSAGEIWCRDDVYAGQAMLLRAFKPV